MRLVTWNGKDELPPGRDVAPLLRAYHADATDPTMAKINRAGVLRRARAGLCPMWQDSNDNIAGLVSFQVNGAHAFKDLKHLGQTGTDSRRHSVRAS